MATVTTNLKFDISSKWDGAGTTAARADIRKFAEELRALSAQRFKVKIDVDLADVASLEARLDNLARDRVAKIQAKADTTTATTAITAAARNRTVRILARADTAAARAELDTLARNRSINFGGGGGSGMNIVALQALRLAALGAAVAIGVLVAAFYTLGAVATAIGAILAAGLGVAIIGIGAAAIFMSNKVASESAKAVSAAQSQVRAANREVESAYKNAASVARNGAESIASAERNVFLTARNGAETVDAAYRNVASTAESGAARIASAERSVQSAIRSTADARKALTTTYKDQERALQDLNMQAAGIPITTHAAQVALKRAIQSKKDLAKTGTAKALDYEEADVAIEQARLRLEELAVTNNRIREDADEANAKGVEGSDEVVAAKQRVVDAEESEAEAVANVAKARKDAADSNADAERNYAKAQRDASEANTEAVERLSKAQRDAAEANEAAADRITAALEAQADAVSNLNSVVAQANAGWKRLLATFAEIAEPLRGPLSDALKHLEARLLAIKPALQEGFTNSVPLVQPLADALFGLAFGAVPGVNSALKESLPIMEGMRDGLTDLSTRIGNMFDLMSDGAVGLGDSWRVWGFRFGEFLEIWGDFVGKSSVDGSRSLDRLFEGINKLTEGILKGITPALEHMAGGASIWYSVFAGIGKIFEIAGPALGQFTEALGGAVGGTIDILVPALGRLVGQLLLGLIPVIQAATPILLKLAEAVVGLLNYLEPYIPILVPIALGLWGIHAVLGPLGIVAGLAAAAFGKLRAVLTLVMTLIGGMGIAAIAAVGAIAVVIAVFAVLAMRSETVRQKIKDAWDAVVGFFKKGEDGISGFQRALNGIGQWFTDLKDKFDFGKLFGSTATMNTIDTVKAALADIKDKWENELKPALQSLGEKLQPLWEALKPVLGVILVIIAAIASGLLGALNGAIRPIAAFIVDIIKNIVNFIKGVVEVVTGLINIVRGFIEVIFNVFKAIFGFFKGLFTGDWSTFKDAIGGIVEGFRKAILDGFWNILKGVWHIIGAIWDTVWAVFKRGGELVAGVVMGFVRGVIAFFTWLWDVLVGHSIVPDLMQAIFDFFMWLPRKIIQIVTTFVTNAIAFFSGLWTAITTTASAFWTIITTKWNAFIDGILAILRNILSSIKNAWDFYWNLIKAAAAMIWDWLTSKWTGFTDGVLAVLNVFLTAIETGWTFWWTLIKTAAIEIWDWITDKWTNFINGVHDKFVTVSTTIKTVWDVFWGTIRDKVEDVKEEIKSKITDFATKIQDTFESLKKRVGEIWDGIKGVFAKPINGMIRIWNEHIQNKFPGLPELSEIPGYATGGPISGPGGGKQDSIHARLSHGEYVVNARSAFQNRDLLDRINFGGEVPRFADGGPVEWMIEEQRRVAPALQVTSAYRTTKDNHGAGKAVDFSNGFDTTPEMQAFAAYIAATWGKNTLELIHSPFDHNIKNGSDVGDGFGFYGAETMNAHRNHVHWAVDEALSDESRGSGIIGAIGNVISSVRNTASTIFKKLTDPLLNSVPDPMTGTAQGIGSMPKAAVTKVRDGIASFIGDKESKAGAAIGGVIPEGEQLKLINEALALTNTPPPGSVEQWQAGLNTLITRESAWNPRAINLWDSNAAKGTPSKGLMQTIDDTFNAHKVAGHDDVYDPVSNIAAGINYIKARYGSITDVQQANANMSPRGYAEGTDSAKPGWAWVGEKGPELVKFNGGEQVVPNDVISRFNEAVADNGIQEKLTDTGTTFLETTADTFIEDFTGGSVENGALGQAIKGIASYGESLQNWDWTQFNRNWGTNIGGGGTHNEVHYHTEDVSSAVRLEEQRKREESLGLGGD